MGRSGLIAFTLVLLLVPAGITIYDAQFNTGHAPPFTLTDTGFQDGVHRDRQTFHLSDYGGQVVVLDFMAVNCASCRFVTPRVLAPLEADYGDRTDFAILSIDGWAGRIGESNEDLIRWQVEEEAPWRHALDTDDAMQKYGVVGLPALIVIDKEGRVVYNHAGVADKKDVEAAVLAAFEGEASAVGVLQVGLVGLAFIAGLASFFAPCSVGLIPAYMGFLVSRHAGGPRGAALRHSLLGGAQTALGIVALYAALAVLFYAFGDALRPHVPKLAPAVAVLLILFGLLMLVGFDWERIARRIGLGKVDGRRGYFAFGVGYGLAAFGCTGPIFLPILLAGFLEGTATGFLVFFVYTAAVASFVLVAAYLVGAGQQGRLRSILSHTKTITRVSALLLIGAGAYLLWFDYQAFGSELWGA